MASLAEVPVKSVYFDGENVLVKQGDGSWVVNKDHEFDFVSNFFAAPGAELKIGALQFKWTAVGSYGVLQPRLLESDGDERAAPAADLTVVMRGLVEALERGRKRRHSRSRSESSDEDSLELPAELQDVALPYKVMKNLVRKRFKEVELEQLVDERDLATPDRRRDRGMITTSDRVVKAVTVLVRYRSAYIPKETPRLLKFLSNVQDIASAYDFAFVSRVVKKHIRAVAAGLCWSADLVVGRTDQRDQLPLCRWCNVYHIIGACEASRNNTSNASGSARPVFYPRAQKQAGESSCFRCGQKGHWARLCPGLRAGDDKPEPSKYRMPPRISSRPSRLGVQSGERDVK